MLKQLAFGEPWRSRPMSDIALAIVGSAVLLLVAGLNYLLGSQQPEELARAIGCT